MSGIQNFVYAIEAGGLRVWIVRIALAALVIGLGIYYAATQFNGFNSAEAMDLAQVGRQVEEGNGFSTKLIRPLILKDHPEWLTAVRDKKEPFPELVHPPAYPALLAALFTVTAPTFDVSPESVKSGFSTYSPEKYVLGMNILLLLISVVVFYLWMARAFDGKVATFATALFIGSDLMWSFAISGLSMQFIILLVCVAGFCLNEALTADETVEYEGMSLLWLAIAAVMVGTLMLTRYSMLAIYLPFAALGFMGFTRKTSCGLIATLIPLGICLPWLIRNIMISGNPFGYAWVQLFAGDSTLWRIYDGDTGNFIGFNQLIRALLNGFGNELSNLGAFFGSLIIPAIFILGFFHMFKRERIQISRWFWGAAFVILLVFNAIIIKTQDITEQQSDMNLLFALFPAVVGYGAAFVFVLVERIQLPSHVLRIPIFVLVCLLQLYPLGVRLVQHRPPPVAYPPYFPPLMQIYYKGLLDKNELQTCDMPWAGAWYGDRLSLWLPKNREDFNKVNSDVFPISAFWLTQVSMRKEVRNGEYGDWANLIEQLDTALYLGGKDQTEYQKTLANALTQPQGLNQPLPYFWPYRIFGSDYYYYFSSKSQLYNLLQQSQNKQ
ncbi:MAG: glycosyltransferase family 39 protein [Verrucomicrobiales bacterium]|jgi:hypothetical protein|nr:glycosyltransferase family 39 protein [Verrucomicrobiales bacterium]